MSNIRLAAPLVQAIPLGECLLCRLLLLQRPQSHIIDWSERWSRMSGYHSLLGLRRRSNPLSVVRFYGSHSHDGVLIGSACSNVAMIAAGGIIAEGLHPVRVRMRLLLLLLGVCEGHRSGHRKDGHKLGVTDVWLPIIVVSSAIQIVHSQRRLRLSRRGGITPLLLRCVRTLLLRLPYSNGRRAV